MNAPNLSEALDHAVSHAVNEAIGHYLSSGVADRDALTRLQDRVHHILLLAEKVPDALKDTQASHAENQKAQAEAAKASQASKEAPPPPKSQAAAR